MASNRIAYGLAKEYGIDTKGMTPKEVWEALKQKGYKVVKVDNRWKDDGAYNGINVDVVSPSGIPIEVQYHTKGNHGIKETLHKDYEISRDSRTPQHIKALANKRMEEVKNLWEIPNNIKEI